MLDKINRIIRQYLHKTTSEDMLYKLSKAGISVGQHTVFFSPSSNVIDTQRPWLLEIGDYCKITYGVVILAHDYSRSVIRRVYGDIVGEAKKTVIGDNVFIGINSVILMGANIGDNVIVGAGSVVHGDIPANTVIAGNPARVICSLEEYYQKRKKSYEAEAFSSAKFFKQKYGRWPNDNEMGVFYPLWGERTRDYLNQKKVKNFLGDDEQDIINCYLHSMPKYSNYNEFLKILEGKEPFGIK